MDKSIFNMFAVLAVLIVISMVGISIMVATTKLEIRDLKNGNSAAGNGVSNEAI